MVAATEAATTDGAGIGPGVRVLAHVARELVGASEAPDTAGPGTQEWTQSDVGERVGLEMRCLDVALCAAHLAARERPTRIATKGTVSRCGRLQVLHRLHIVAT